MKLWENAMNEMSPDLIAGAMEYEKEAAQRTEKRRRLMKRWIPVAACLLLGVLIGGIVWSRNPGWLIGKPLRESIETESTSPLDYSAVWASAQTGLVQETIWESYHVEIPEGPFAGYQSSYVCDDALVGEKLGEVSVQGAWVRIAYEFRAESGKTEASKTPASDPETLRAEVFCIRGIAPETAVCLKYLDKSEAISTEHSISFLNPAAEFPMLSALFEAVQAAERTSLIRKDGMTSLSVETASAKGISRTSYFTDEAAAEALVKALLSLDGPTVSIPSVPVREETILASCQKRASFRISIVGIGNWNVIVYDNGYLQLALSGVDAALFTDGLSRVFEIVSVSAEDLILLMEQSGTAYVPKEGETVTVYTEVARPE